MKIKVITLVIESFEKFTILIKLQTKVKIISPFWNICSVSSGSSNIKIIIDLKVIK